MDRIKESFDSLPAAACFFDRNGMVRLVNHRMLAVMNYLRPDGVQTLDELEAALKAPPGDICSLDPELSIYRFPDGRVLQFAKEQITTEEGRRYTQVTAIDVTKLMERQAELKAENDKLTQANDSLRRLFDKMPELIREEETLQMKLRVHDDIGHSILASRRVLQRKAELQELKAAAAQWEQSIAVLYRSNEMREQSDPLTMTLDKAGEMGIHVLTSGSTPDAPGIRTLAALAINECAANCVRHADGTKLYAHFEEIQGRRISDLSNNGTSQKEEMREANGYAELILTNNGMPPREEIREGGGLSMLRHRVEEAGGSMEIKSLPRFELTIRLPQASC